MAGARPQVWISDRYAGQQELAIICSKAAKAASQLVSLQSCSHVSTAALRPVKSITWQ